MTAILPSDIPPLSPLTKTEHHPEVERICNLLDIGMLSPAEVQQIVQALPNEMLREIVRKVAGTDESFLMTFKKQVALVDAVISQLVDVHGRLKPQANELDISLKDALTLSNRASEMMVKHLPKLYTVDRIQRMERAIGDVMEEHMTSEQQHRVLERLHELTAGAE